MIALAPQPQQIAIIDLETATVVHFEQAESEAEAQGFIDGFNREPGHEVAMLWPEWAPMFEEGDAPELYAVGFWSERRDEIVLSNRYVSEKDAKHLVECYRKVDLDAYIYREQTTAMPVGITSERNVNVVDNSRF